MRNQPGITMVAVATQDTVYEEREVKKIERVPHTAVTLTITMTPERARLLRRMMCDCKFVTAKRAADLYGGAYDEYCATLETVNIALSRAGVRVY